VRRAQLPRAVLAGLIVLLGYLAGRAAFEWAGAALAARGLSPGLAALAPAPIYVGLVVAAVWGAARVVPSVQMVWASLGPASSPRRQLAAGVVLSALLVAAVFAVELAGGWLAVARAALSARLLSGIAGYFLLYAVIAFNEELVFRGALLTLLSGPGGRVAGVVGSSLLFTAVHVADVATSQRLIGLFLLGVVLAQLYLWSRSLWLPIAVHWGVHALSFAAVLGLPPLRLVLSGPVGLIGTADQLDAGWVTILALAVLAVLLTRAPASRVLSR
jgi:membrane protease YdiL (CAAX protease family)